MQLCCWDSHSFLLTLRLLLIKFDMELTMHLLLLVFLMIQAGIL